MGPMNAVFAYPFAVHMLLLTRAGTTAVFFLPEIQRVHSYKQGAYGADAVPIHPRVKRRTESLCVRSKCALARDVTLANDVSYCGGPCTR